MDMRSAQKLFHRALGETDRQILQEIQTEFQTCDVPSGFKAFLHTCINTKLQTLNTKYKTADRLRFLESYAELLGKIPHAFWNGKNTDIEKIKQKIRWSSKIKEL